MKRALLSFLIGACVPASEPAPPAGAAGYEIEPDTAAAGESYGTADGWTITIEKLVLQVAVSAQPTSQGYGSAEPWLVDARHKHRLYVPALPVGDARVRIDWYSRYVDEDPERSFQIEINNAGVDEETAARFSQAPDETNAGTTTAYTDGSRAVTYHYGPSVVLVARAQHATYGTYTVDLALNVTTDSFGGFGEVEEDRGTPVTVPEDGLAPLPLRIEAITLFPLFDGIAAHDANHDGKITASELGTDLAALESRLGSLLVARRP